MRRRRFKVGYSRGLNAKKIKPHRRCRLSGSRRYKSELSKICFPACSWCNRLRQERGDDGAQVDWRNRSRRVTLFSIHTRDTRLLTLLIAMLATMVFCKFYPAASIWESDMEAVYFIGAFILLTALIYGTLQYHYRNRAATRAGDEVARERYRRNEG
jgi:hypothetical protein